MAGQGTRAIELLRAAGVDHRVHEYSTPQPVGRARDERPAYGLEAAAALGVAPERLFKTIVVRVDGRLALAVVPVAGEVDLRRFAAALGGRTATLAEPAEAERATGSVIGGISPLAPRRPLPVVLDPSAAAHATILVSAGRRGLQVELAPDDLARLVDARMSPIVRTFGLPGLVNGTE
jgi:Cys-tRNA(Pro)/Cys-tRNA(Cys) deacylase